MLTYAGMRVQVMQNLYLKDDSEALHPLLAEALLDMLALLVTELKMMSLNLFSRYAGTQFTCFTGTKVQILTLLPTDKPEPFAMPEMLCHSLLTLLVQKYKY
jgi:hypothetical protein